MSEEIIPDAEQKEFKPAGTGISLSLVLCIIALLGLGLLYVLFFINKHQMEKAAQLPPALTFSKPGGLTVAFVNSDTIKSHYQLVKDLQLQLERKYATLDGEIRQKQAAIQNKAADLQKKVESNQIGMDDAKKLDEQLRAESQKVYELNQQYSDKMEDEEYRLNQVFVDSIDNYLKRFNAKYNFDYILGYSRGGGILYARDTLDITDFVLKGLNEEYLRKYPR